MSQTRRHFLRISGATVAASVAGCSSVSDVLSGGSGGSDPLGMVPQGVSAVARGNVTETLTDSAVEQFVNTILDLLNQQEYYTGPATKAEILDQFETQVGLDLTQANTAVGFLKYTGPTSREQYSGFWFDADWSEDAVIGALEQSSQPFVEESYNGQAVYHPDVDYRTTWIGVADANQYVVGNETAVKDTIDVAAGDAESVSGGLKDTYSQVRSAPFKFSAVVPEDTFTQSSTQIGGSTIDLQQFSNISHVAGATYHEDDTAGIVVEMPTGGSEEAQSVNEALNAGLIALESTMQSGELRAAVSETSVSTDGSTVVAEVSGPVDQAATVIKLLFQRFFLF